MFGPGEYVPDPTEGIVDANDLPMPLVVKPRHNRLCWLSPLNTVLPGVTVDAAPTAQSVPASAGARLKGCP